MKGQQSLGGTRHTIWEILLARLSEADAAFTVAQDGEQRRTAMLLALRAQLEFNQSARPKIASAALSALFVDLAGLSVGQMSDVFKKAAGHGLPLSDNRRNRDAMIAVAFRLLTEGGQRSGNMSREQAGRFIAPQLKALGVTDRGGNFTWKRVTNIYLETVKKPRSRLRKLPISSLAAANAILRDRMQAFPHTLFQEAVDACHRYLPDTLRKLEERKRVATGLLQVAARLDPT